MPSHRGGDAMIKPVAKIFATLALIALGSIACIAAPGSDRLALGSAVGPHCDLPNEPVIIMIVHPSFPNNQAFSVTDVSRNFGQITEMRWEGDGQIINTFATKEAITDFVLDNLRPVNGEKADWGILVPCLSRHALFLFKGEKAVIDFLVDHFPE